jgi:hypothetical protein
MIKYAIVDVPNYEILSEFEKNNYEFKHRF